MMKMMKMMKIKNNKIIVSTIVGIVVVALIGGYFLFMQPKSAEAEKNGVNSIFYKSKNQTKKPFKMKDFQVWTRRNLHPLHWVSIPACYYIHHGPRSTDLF